MAEPTVDVVGPPGQLSSHDVGAAVVARRQAEADHVLSRLREHVLSRPQQPVWLSELVILATIARGGAGGDEVLVQADVLNCLRFLRDANELRVVVRGPDRRWCVSSLPGGALARHVRQEWDAVERPLVRGDICVVRGILL